MEVNPDVSLNIKPAAAESAPTQAAEPHSAAQRVKPETAPSAPQTQESAIKEMLLADGFKASAENIKLAGALIEGQLPVNRENLQKLNQGLRLLGIDIDSGKIEEALFMLKNDIRPTAKNAEILRSFIDGSTKIMAQLESLLGAIKELPDAALRENILKALLGDTAKPSSAPDNAMPREAPAQNPPPTSQAQAQAGQTSQATPLTGEAAAQVVRGLPMPQGATAQAPQSIQNPALILEGAVKPQGDAPANAAAGAQPLAAQSVLVSKEGQPPPVAQNPQTGTQAAPPSGETAAFSREAAVTQTVDPKPDAAIMKPPPDGVVKEPSAAVVSRELPAQQQGLEPNPNIKPQAESQSGSALHVPHSALTRETAIPDERTLFAQVKQRLLFDPNGTSNKDVDEFLNRLRDSIEAARAELAKSNAPETGRLMRELTFVRESLEFVNHIKENIYLQLPISVHNNETNGEILVFRNKQRKKKEDGSVSALIALDTLKLGRFEVYVQKTGKSVNCQFRLRDEKIESLTRANIPRLQAMLTAQGYSLSEVTYKKAEESFTLLDKPREESSETPLGKFAFDMKM